MAIVYQHRRVDTKEVFYIGIGKSIKRAYDKTGRSLYWNKYTAKYEYEIEITHEDIIWEEACSIEKYLISFYGRKDLRLGALINQTDGGEGAINPSAVTKKLISDSKLGDLNPAKRLVVKNKIANTLLGRKHKIKTLELFSKQRSKENNPMYGKTHSQDAIDKIKAANRFYWENEENRLRVSKRRTGKIMDNETKKKLSEKNRGEKNPFYGKKHTEETKLKLKKAWEKRKSNHI
jgi:hypothetical protein